MNIIISNKLDFRNDLETVEAVHMSKDKGSYSPNL